MSKFKMQSPYKKDPVPVYEVPFDDPSLMGKANKNGSIIMNKDQARDPEMRDKILKHEKHHLKEMIIDKNPDGSPVLDYDADSVTYKGVNYSRDEFDEGNKELPWEKEAYNENEDIDIIPNPDKLSPLNLKKMGEHDGHADQDEVNMNESFNPLTMKNKILKGHRGNINPFKMMQDKGLLNKNAQYSHLRGPSFIDEEFHETDPPKKEDLDTKADTSAQADLQKNIDAGAYASTREDETGTYFDYTGTGGASDDYHVGTDKMSNDEWKAWLKTPAGKKYTASKNVSKTVFIPKKKEEEPEPKEKTIGGRNLATFLEEEGLYEAYNKTYYDSATNTPRVKHTPESFMKQYGYKWDSTDNTTKESREHEARKDGNVNTKYDDLNQGTDITSSLLQDDSQTDDK